MWYAPLLVVLGVYFIAMQVGTNSALACLGTMLLFLPFTGRMAMRMSAAHRKAAASSDERISLISSVLQG